MSETQIQGSAADTNAEHAAAHAGHPSGREYVRIFLILVAITALEVAIYYVREELGAWFIPTLFGLAAIKFLLVVLWFMHLKFDDRRFSRFFLMGFAGAATLYLVVLISFRVFLR